MSEFKLNYTGQEIQNKLDKIDEINTLQSRMDALTSLSEGSTTGDAELVDIRVKADGTTAPTAGTAVREQISELKGDIGKCFNKNIIIPANDGGLHALTVKVGETFIAETVDGSKFPSTKILRIYDKNKQYIDFYTLDTSMSSRTVVYEGHEEDIYYFGFTNGVMETDVKIINYVNETLESSIDSLESSIDSLESSIDSHESSIDSLESEMLRILDKNIIIPANDGGLHALTVKVGETFIAETVDGSKFPSTKILRIYDKNKQYIDFYTLDTSMSSRTVVYEGHEEDIYYFGFTNGVMETDVRVNLVNNNNISHEVDDLEKRVNVLEQDISIIPDFYNNYVETRISQIQNRDLIVGNHGDSFIFITDLHDENNYYSPSIASRIVKNTNSSMIVYGGDYINEPSSKLSAITLLRERVNKCRVDNNTIFMFGNHDSNPYGTGQLSKEEFYSIADKKNEICIETNKKTYFYKDNKSQKIRYFFLDSGLDGNFEQEQLTWVTSHANELSSNWTIVLFSHMAIANNGKDDRVNVYKYEFIDSLLNALNNINATIACMICGHIHIDISYTSGKFPIIATTCDAHGVQSSGISSDNREVNTINEQAFDVFHIDTENRKIYVTRIGGGQYDVTQGTDLTLNDREFTY